MAVNDYSTVKIERQRSPGISKRSVEMYRGERRTRSVTQVSRPESPQPAARRHIKSKMIGPTQAAVSPAHQKFSPLRNPLGELRPLSKYIYHKTCAIKLKSNDQCFCHYLLGVWSL